MKKPLGAAVLFVFAVQIALAQTDSQPRISIAQVVAQGYPSDIDITPQVAGPDSCHAVLSSYSDGTPHLVAAAYTNGVFGHLRMLSVNSDTLTVSVLADVTKSQYMLGGAGCHLEIVSLSTSSLVSPLSQVLDLDLPGLSGQGASSWFFKWDGSNLVNLTPVEIEYSTPPPDTLLYEAWPVDVEHTGVKQIISNGDIDLHPGPDGLSAFPKQLWKFDGTSFVLEKTLVLLQQFTRDKGNQPPVDTGITPDTCYQMACQEFDMRNLAAQYK